MRFLDTNILLYSLSTDIDEAHKRARAIELLDSSDVVISVQVLQEFYVQATRPSRLDPLDHDLATAFIRKWRRFQVVETSVELLDTALDIAKRYRLSYWDAAILAAAAAANCDELMSEDLAHGSVLANVRIINPFR